MKRSLKRGALVIGLSMTIGLGLAGQAAAHDSYYGGSYSWSYSADALADRMEAKADYLRYKASRLDRVTVLSAAQADVLQARLRDSAADLDALAAETRPLKSESAIDAAYADYKAELASVAPTLRAAKQAFYGTSLRTMATFLAAKAAGLQAMVDSLQADDAIADEDAAAVEAMIAAARAKISAARAVLTPSVLGARIMTDPSAASSTLSTAAKRLYGAKYWLRTARYALYEFD